MRFVSRAGIGALLACVPLGTIGCASLPRKLSAIPLVARQHSVADEYRLALKAEQQKDYVKARDLYESLQRRASEVPLYAHRMGVVSTQLNDHATAAKYFEHARKLDPNNASLLTDMGYSAIMQQDYARAEGLLTAAVKLRPENTRAVNNLALALGHQGRFDESLATFRKINSESNALSNLAYVHIQRDEQSLAVECYRRAVSLEPNNKSLAAQLAQLETQISNGTSVPAQPVIANSATTTAPVTTAAAEFPADIPTEPLLSSATAPPLVHASEFLPSPGLNVSIPEAVAASRPRDRLPDDEERPFFEDGEPEVRTQAVAEREQPRQHPLSEFEQPLIVPNGAFVSPVAGTHTTSASRTASLEVTSATAVATPQQVVITAWDADLELPSPSAPPKPLSESSNQSDELASVLTDDDNRPETKSADAEELTGLEWVKDEQATLAAAHSGTPETGFVELADGLKGFCPVAIRDDRRLTVARDEFSFEYQSQDYRFSSAEALAKFQANPELYAPMAGGLDVVAVRQGAAVANGSLDHAVWFRHRLHLFSTLENLAAFRAAPRTFAAVQ